MKIEFNSLYWSNICNEQVQAHKSVFSKLEIPINYHETNMPHGAWMDSVCNKAESDLIGFFDIDCVPINKDLIIKAWTHASLHDNFIGIAQASNHIGLKNHIFAAPAFFIISKNCWNKLQVSFSENKRSDVAEELSYRAEELGINYRCIYPTHYERDPSEGKWRLGNYGFFGIGTVFGNYCYHLYQGRTGLYTKNFIETCSKIIDETFSTDGFISSTFI